MRPKTSSADKKATSYKDTLLNGKIPLSDTSDESDDDFQADTDYESSSELTETDNSDSEATDSSTQTLHDQLVTNQLNGDHKKATATSYINPKLVNSGEIHVSRVCCVCLNDDNM